MFGETINYLTGAPTPCRVGYYRFNEGAALTVADSGSGPANPARIMNAAFSTGHTWVAGPTPLTLTSTTFASEAVGPMTGGTALTVTGNDFANSPWLKCVFGEMTDGPVLSTAAYSEAETCPSGARPRPDGK
eukprot:2390773-Pyramimonas_sp.AAC.1